MKRAIAPNQLSPVLTLLVIVGVLLSLTRGPMDLPAGQSLLAIWDSIWGTSHNGLKEFQQVVVWELRLPRTLLAVFTGALLSLCGAVTQGLFRNPLADPGIIGVSTGAGLGAAIAIVIIPISLSAFVVPMAAFIGGLCTTILVYKLAQSPNGTSVLVLLLAGIAIAAFAGAAIGFLTYVADDQKLRDLTLWGMGTLNGATFGSAALVSITCLILFLVYMKDAPNLNAILMGEPEARHLGIDVERFKIRMITFTAIGVGIAVATTGVIGFVGLVVPHLIRMLVGPNHKVLLPLSALTGAALLLVADVCSRIIMAPAELPVGLMTAIFGAPFFTFLLIKQRKHLI